MAVATLGCSCSITGGSHAVAGEDDRAKARAPTAAVIVEILMFFLLF